MVKNALLMLAGLLIAGAAYAECSTQGCSDVYVNELYMTHTAGFYIQTSGTETLAGCTPDSGVFLYVPGALPRMKELYATLLAAQLAEKKVFIRILEGSNPCTVEYVRLARQ